MCFTAVSPRKVRRHRMIARCLKEYPVEPTRSGTNIAGDIGLPFPLGDPPPPGNSGRRGHGRVRGLCAVLFRSSCPEAGTLDFDGEPTRTPRCAPKSVALPPRRKSWNATPSPCEAQCLSGLLLSFHYLRGGCPCVAAACERVSLAPLPSSAGRGRRRNSACWCRGKGARSSSRAMALSPLMLDALACQSLPRQTQKMCVCVRFRCVQCVPASGCRRNCQQSRWTTSRHRQP